MAKMKEVPEIDFTKPVADQIETIVDIEYDNQRLERGKTFLRYVTDFKARIRKYEKSISAARKAAEDWRADTLKEINDGGNGELAYAKHNSQAHAKLRFDC